MFDYGTLCGVVVGFGCGVVGGWLLRGRRTRETSDNGLTASVDDSSVGECKLVLVVRNDLKMGKGKVAAQCSHAAVSAFEKLSRKDPSLLERWYYFGQPKVVLKTDDEQSMMQIANDAKKLGLNVSLVQDAGRTQIAPGSKTVVGIGPASAELIDQVTGHLKLF